MRSAPTLLLCGLLAACAGKAQSSGNDTATTGASGAAGAPADCLELACLNGATFVYRPTRKWKNPGGPPSEELAEADYEPEDGQTLGVSFSGDAAGVTLSGGETVQGQRDLQHTDRAWFNLEAFAGGRFVVMAGDVAFQAEHTLYGSGVPITSSTRGSLEPAP